MARLSIRPETPNDKQAVFDVIAAAFPTDVEARLVDRLRENGKLLVSLVAVLDGRVIGHVALSPVEAGEDAVVGAGLAPVSVEPSQQRQGAGAQLIRDGLERCRKVGIPFAVVLGEPEYYGRFDFLPAREFGLVDEYGGGDAFMALELSSGALDDVEGVVRYGPEFAGL